MKRIKWHFLPGWVLIFIAGTLYGQKKFLTNNGFISFYSHTPIEDITADNHQVGAVIDAAQGDVAVIVQMTRFEFEKKLMQEHFNENFVESEKYPRATFNGRITNNNEVDYSSAGIYGVRVEGEMTIHGVTRQVSAEGTVEITENGLVARTEFKLNPKDYEIRIPRVVRDNIAEEMVITAELSCQPI
ncbi:MAG: YceI family protein [Bacteroidales bacterium]